MRTVDDELEGELGIPRLSHGGCTAVCLTKCFISYDANSVSTASRRSRACLRDMKPETRHRDVARWTATRGAHRSLVSLETRHGRH
ncbi:hypothetical protein HNP02_003154 [Mycobacterium sp. AZCC_0083]|nr:hypothetical protein [Mycobacterium sp. AZCC_0083]